MYPDEVAWTIYVHYSAGKSGIGLLVRSPMLIRRERGRVRGRRDILPEEIVEEWPKSLQTYDMRRDR
jgi:hypothetical protein